MTDARWNPFRGLSQSELDCETLAYPQVCQVCLQGLPRGSRARRMPAAQGSPGGWGPSLKAWLKHDGTPSLNPTYRHPDCAA